MDSDGDGVGDLPGITEKLDYVRWLGADAVWISPFYPSPQEDFGYDVSDYAGVDLLFGTLADFDELLAEAHYLGLKVILDFVPNHTSREHPWFLESRSSREDPKRDWYIWRDGRPGSTAKGAPPNNWRGAADTRREGSAWTFDERTDQYYLATFSPAQPDLNWRNAEVRAVMLEALRFWLERGVDGFRLDMVDFLSKDERFRDEPSLPEGVAEEERWVRAIHQMNRPETLEYVRQMTRVIRSYPDRVAIGEVLYHLPIERLVSYGAPDLLQIPLNQRLIFLPLEARTLRAFVDRYDRTALAAGTWPNWSLGNHDHPRVRRLGEAGARLAAMLLLTLKGTPFVYYGDEIGMENVPVPPDRRQDPWAAPESGLSRDPQRTPMQWDGSPNAGFCPPYVEPWLPVADNHREVNVVAEREDARSMLFLYQRLIALRRAERALSVGCYEPVETSSDDLMAYRRERGGRQFLVILNIGRERCAYSPEDELVLGRLALSTHLDRDGERISGRVELRGREGVIIELRP